jgi:hypothetical protein
VEEERQVDGTTRSSDGGLGGRGEEEKQVYRTRSSCTTCTSCTSILLMQICCGTSGVYVGAPNA